MRRMSAISGTVCELSLANLELRMSIESRESEVDPTKGLVPTLRPYYFGQQGHHVMSVQALAALCAF
jgi:hypothetical protein